MICIDVPEHLMKKITVFARLAEQTPEQLTLEMLEEWVDHQSAYIETHYPGVRQEIESALMRRLKIFGTVNFRCMH